jgi:hypothetical protein
MHQTVDLKVLYFGTPVVLIGTRNPDGTANLAPMSSAWWLGDQCMLGMNSGSQTTRNLLRAHVHEDLIVAGTAHIDPLRWDPLIMKFCEFFGGGEPVHSSRLARAWQIPETAHA